MRVTRVFLPFLAAISLFFIALFTLSLPLRLTDGVASRAEAHDAVAPLDENQAGAIGFLTGPNDGNALEIALAYLEQNKDQFALTSADIEDLIVTDQYVSSHTGVTHIYLRQRLNGLEVLGGNININIAPDGTVMNVGSRVVKCNGRPLSLSAHSGAEECLAQDSRQPTLSAIDAVISAAEQLELAISKPLLIQDQRRNAAQEIKISDGGISQAPIPAKLVYQPLQTDALRLAWEMVIHPENGQNWWNVRVDAQTGEILAQHDWIISEHVEAGSDDFSRSETRGTTEVVTTGTTGSPNSLATAQYRVIPFPYVSPEDAGVAHELVSDPSDAVASPFGWHDTDGVAGVEFTDTRGNNVFAQEDVDGNDKGGFRPDGGEQLIFDYAFDAAFHPTGNFNQEASVINLFYWSNLNHDIFYHYGFDEMSGNFQQNNYERGGVGGDALQADTQDRSSMNNANFGTPPEGEAPVMQMFVWDFTAPYRDSALENGVIVHEYGHGVSNRLTGGPNNVNCLFNSEQMGEGWSDWFALALTTKEGDQGSDARGMGPYLFGQAPTSQGVRTYPYSTDMNINPHTYRNLKETVSVHQVGEIWGAMLWDMYWLLVDEHGFNPDVYDTWHSGGNNLAIQLVMDGMKLQPCSPGFVDGRDAILLADQMLTDGANQCLIWQAFAERGLGFSANQGDASNTTDGKQAFDMPPHCQFLQVTPATQDICVGEPADYEVALGSGYLPPVTLSATALPTGSQASFTPNPLSTEQATGTLTIAQSEGISAGRYPITIMGTDEHLSAELTVELRAFDTAPSPVTLMTPSDGATNVSRNTTFGWAAATQGASYMIEVDDQADFSSINYTATVTETTHMATSSLKPLTTYYWRVRASNPCDTGHDSETFHFTTKDIFPILVVDDDGVVADMRPYYEQALETLGQNYDVWDSYRSDDEPDASFLAPYEMVIWFTGDSFGGFAGPGEEGEAALASYLDQGGCFFLSSQTYHYDRQLTPFMQNYLGIDTVTEDAHHTELIGKGIFNEKGSYTLNYPLPNYSDLIMPNESAQVALSGNSGPAAISKENLPYRTLFFGFPFEAIGSRKERVEVMQAIIKWCGIDEETTTLTGRVRDADSGYGIRDARVTARNSRIQRATTTDGHGYYTMTLTLDAYEISASAPNYEQHVLSIDMKEAIKKQDFALHGSTLNHADLGLEQAVHIGQVISNSVTITNSGPLPINYRLSIGGNYRYFLPVLTTKESSQENTREQESTREQEALPRYVDHHAQEGQKATQLGQAQGITPTYRILDSQQANGPTYKFVDITRRGTLVPLSDNNSAGPFPIGFDFDFYGTPQHEFYINSNGFLSFEAGSSALSNQCLLPKARTPNNLIAVMWDDFDPADIRAQAYYQSFSACPYGTGACLVVQYDQYHYYPSTNYRRATFEAILFENGDILMQYDHLGGKNGLTSTTGLENAEGTSGITYGTCDTFAHLPDNHSICFAHPDGNRCESGIHEWASVTPEHRTIAPNSSTTLEITFDGTTQAQLGEQSAYLWLFGNYVNQLEPIPLTMTLECPTCGKLMGTFSDAESDEAVTSGMNVSGPDGFNLIVHDNEYDLDLQPGSYDLTVNANHYLSQTTTITVTAGTTISNPFALIPNVPKLDITPTLISESLTIGQRITRTVTISNSGLAELTLDLHLEEFKHQIDSSREPVAAQAGTHNRESKKNCPTAYERQGKNNTLDILLYADDIIHRPPQTYPEQALQARELAYTAYYYDWEEFEECLINEEWDLVIIANERIWPLASVRPALNDYVKQGGKLIYQSWTITFDPSSPLWRTMGFAFQDNNETPKPLHWWQPQHPIFTNPKEVPPFSALEEFDFLIYSQQVEPLTDSHAIAGYTPAVSPNQAALVVGNQGRTVFKGFLDAPNSADLDQDGILDSVELWTNLIVGIINEFDPRTQWVRITPDQLTIPPGRSVTVDIRIDTHSLEQAGDYSATLNLLGNQANDVPPVPLRIRVTR